MTAPDRPAAAPPAGAVRHAPVLPFSARLRADARLRTECSVVNIEGLVASRCDVPSGGAFELVEAPPAWHLVRIESGRLRLHRRDGAAIVADAPGRTVVFDAAPVVGGEVEDGTAFECLSFLVRILQEHLARHHGLPPGAALSFADGAALDPALETLLFQLGGALRAGSGREPRPAALSAVAHDLRHAALSVVLHAVAHNHADRLGRPAGVGVAPGHVKRAADFMRSNAARPLSLAEIAAAAGASVRTLQLGFRRFHGCSPSEYLRHLRLQGARQDLLDLQDGAGVAQVARRWGFAHQGLFAARYREAFGELPSRTRARKGLAPEGR